MNTDEGSVVVTDPNARIGSVTDTWPAEVRLRRVFPEESAYAACSRKQRSRANVMRT